MVRSVSSYNDAWYCMVLHVIVWYRMVLHSIARYCMVCTTWYCMVLHGIVWYYMVLHGIAWYCMVLHGIAWFCMVFMVLHGFHGIAWYCTVLHSIAWYCMVLHGIAWFCMVLHYLAPSCTILHQRQHHLKKPDWDLWYEATASLGFSQIGRPPKQIYQDKSSRCQCAVLYYMRGTVKNRTTYLVSVTIIDQFSLGKTFWWFAARGSKLDLFICQERISLCTSLDLSICPERISLVCVCVDHILRLDRSFHRWQETNPRQSGSITIITIVNFIVTIVSILMIAVIKINSKFLPWLSTLST